MEFDWFAFLIAFAIGMTIVYMTSPTRKTVFKYPTQENVGKVVYQDKDQSCYVYAKESVSCPMKDK